LMRPSSVGVGRPVVTPPMGGEPGLFVVCQLDTQFFKKQWEITVPHCSNKALGPDCNGADPGAVPI
jgi:hypothetical protein